MTSSEDGPIVPSSWRTDAYEYELPEGLVAQEPAHRREDARLLVVPRGGGADGPLLDRRIPDLADLLRPNDLLILNDTRVIPARLRGVRAGTGGQAEALILEYQDGAIRLLLGTRGKPEPGETIVVGDGSVSLQLVANEGEGVWTATTDLDDDRLRDAMGAHGRIPLPPYIHRNEGDRRNRLDRDRYQTVFAARDGAVAAPTAGLHLTEPLLERFAAAGVERATVTLHVGPGTFRPVMSDDIRRHPMHEERYEVPPGTADAVARCRAAGGRIIPVGTTAVRVLESAATAGGTLAVGSGRTRLFIHPPWEFRFVDALVTNFHAPRSTLLMLVAALAGQDRILAAYAHAVAQRYRFLSYGDAMFIA